LELLSVQAFEVHHVNESVWKEQFNMFLPLILCPDHAKRARKTLVESLRKIANKKELTSIPDVVLYVLPKLMNTMIVSMMQGKTDETKFYVESFISERALLGYCSFHHMLLFFANEYPAIQTRIDSIVEKFMASPDDQQKSVVPDLGEFLALMSLSKHSWNELAKPLLKELLTRNVLWTLKKHPNFVGAPGPEKIQQMWGACRTSWRLVMFQVYFLDSFGHPQGKSWDYMLEHYNRSFGRPNEVMKNKLHEAVLTMAKVQSWPQFFNFLHVPCPSQAKFAQTLSTAVKTSSLRGYH